jgi:S-DNA-T family DNA segregation ATPase FtsK/SpoIIIE
MLSTHLILWNRQEFKERATMSTVSFHRATRSYPERLPQDEIAIVAPQPPPKPNSGGGLGILQFLLPIVGSLTSVLFFLSSPTKSPLLLIGVGGMVVASAGSGLLLRFLQNRQIKQQALAYRQKYVRYLASVTIRLEDISQRQHAVNRRLYPAVEDLPQVVTQRAALWEHALHDEDFLQVRIGTGVVPLTTQVRVDIGANPLAEFDPDLLTKANAVVSKYAQMDDAPITLTLRDHAVVAIQGAPEQTRGLTRALIDQIATLHAPNDVRIMALFAAAQTEEWAWLKWLPHTRCVRRMRAEDMGGAEPLCLMADDPDDALVLLQTQVVAEVERRRKIKGAASATVKTTPIKPHFILIIDGYAPRNPMARLAPLEEWLRANDDLGVTVVCLVRETSDEPPTTQVRLAFTKGGTVSLSETAYGGRRHEFITPDTATVTASEQLARQMTPLVLTEENAETELAQDVRLLPLLGIPSTEAFQLTETWQPRSRNDLLRVPIGLGADGAPLLLDIREAAEGGMGPHGMVIGATGSGKSELLRTIVTSLAVTHDPETLNFILADFKGGASFADLAQLPHAAGMITNLQSDLSQVDRMRAALFGEQERRQRLLRTWGNLDNIRQYHQQRLQQPEMEPMPYLMIIVDEFAELLTQRPDFLELFVAIGRVGRSLGMHMLLATQRLGEGRIQGLEGHLRYRICLRTFSAAESSAVLGTPDAFYLPAFPGIGYFKVDTTIYKQFKTALITIPATTAATADDAPPMRRFTATGKLIPLNAPAPTTHAVDSLQTEMDAVIARIHAQYHPHSKVHQVWLPALDTKLTLGQVMAQSGITLLAARHAAHMGPLQVPLGLIDLPAEQEQRPFVLDFAGANGHLALVGAPLSGKSVALQTLMMSLMVTHTPQEVQIYAIDMGGGLLRAFEDAPHVGAVCGGGERDTIRRLLRQVRSVIELREILFREQRLDGIAAFRARRSAGDLLQTPFGDVFLVIDNIGQLRNEIDDIDLEITELAAKGLTYGVHIVLTANRWSDVRAKLRDTIGARLELRLNDPVDSEMGKAAAQSLLNMPPGRGIIKGGLQFQVALPSVERDRVGRGAIEACIAAVKAQWPGMAAPPLRLLPPVLWSRDLPQAGNDARPGVPIGIDEFQLEPVYVDLPTMGPHFMIFGDGETGKTNLLRLWLHALTQRQSPEEVRFALIDNRRTLLDMVDAPHLLAYSCTQPMLKDLLEKVRAAVEPRLLTGATLSLEELRKPRSWTGPRYVLFVDDYEGLVTSAGNPLAPLGELIAQGKDVGFHLVIARRVAGSSRASLDPVLQRLKEMATPTLILSGDPQEGALIGTQRAAALPPGRGFFVRRNQRTLLVQTALIASDAPEKG